MCGCVCVWVFLMCVNSLFWNVWVFNMFLCVCVSFLLCVCLFFKFCMLEYVVFVMVVCSSGFVKCGFVGS